MRVVLDTHIFLRLIIPFLEINSPFLERDKIEICLNESLFDEYTGRARSHGYRISEIIRLLQRLESQGFLVKKGMTHCNSIDVPNPQLQEDMHLIQLAVASKAEIIITNDFDDLLAYHEKILREFSIKTLRPEEFDFIF